MALLAWMIAAALAAPPPDAVAALDAGDEAWFTGHRAAGIRAWRQALALTDQSADGQALEAMVRLRLLHAGSNWSALVHGPRIDRGMQAPTDWGWLAVSDFHWLAPVEVGAVRQQAVAAAEQARSLPERVASRRALASGVPPEDPEDGLGRALTSGWVPDRGGWALGVGVVAGPVTGLGVAARWVQPDAFRQGVYVSLDGFVAWYGYGAQLQLETPGRLGAVVRGGWTRSRVFEDEAWTPVQAGSVLAGARLQLGRLRVELTPELRLDRGDAGGLVGGHGGWLRTRLDLRRDRDQGLLLMGGVGSTVPGLADYLRFAGEIDVRGYVPVHQGVLAGQVTFDGVLGSDIPWVRLPTIGGPYRHRGGRYGEFRGDWAAVTQLELRHPLGLSWLWGAVFADLAYVEGAGLHGGGGGGLRLVLPPVPHNTIRLDCGFSDSTWQLHIAWGEAF